MFPSIQSETSTPFRSPATTANMIHPRQLLWVVVVAACGLAWANRFIQDDAFISLRYAQNLVEGHGLVWNPGGDRVEGYTNFLWTVILALPIWAGVDPFMFISVLGVAMLACTLLATYGLAIFLFCKDKIALLATAIAGANYSFSCYATGGLETQLQTLLLTTCMVLAAWAERCRAIGVPVLCAFSFLSALAVLTRLDSGLLVAIIGLVMCWVTWQKSATTSDAIGRLIVLAAPFAAIVSGWLVWKIFYYGDFLPNTFYVKAENASPVRGFYYVGLFLAVYLFFPFLALFAGNLKRVGQEMGAGLAAMVFLSLAAWIAYVIKVGGDFMEFRFMVPIIPLIAIAVAWTIDRYCQYSRTRACAITVLCGLSMLHAFAFDRMPWKRSIESIRDLKYHISDPSSNWIGIGRFLGTYFKNDPSVVIAVTPAGAIPFFSRLTSIDMLGLNDRWIARHGVKLSDRAGHHKITTVAHLVDAGATFVIGHPTMMADTSVPIQGISLDQLQTMFVGKPVPDPTGIPLGTKVVLMPIAPHKYLLAIYLTPTPHVDRLLAEFGWDMVPILEVDAKR